MNYKNDDEYQKLLSTGLWKPLSKNYLINENGEVYGKRYNKFLSPIKRDYLYFHLSINDKLKIYPAHVLVAKTFIPNPNDLPCVNHKDGNKYNNHVSNLEWVTFSQNTKHAFEKGLMKASDKNKTSIKQYTKDGIYIATYDSIADASRITGIPYHCIKAALRRNQCTKGYKFVYLKHRTDKRVNNNLCSI